MKLMIYYGRDTFCVCKYNKIVHALSSRRVAVALQAHMPAVHPEMTIWGVKGGPPHFLCAKSYFFCYLERHATFQNDK